MRARQRRGVSNFDGRRLRRARDRKGLSPRELASRAGVTVTVLGQYERGERSPELGTLERLAGALGCSPQDLRVPARTTLRDLREAAGVSQQAAAAATGLSRSTYAMLEQGRTKFLPAQAASHLAGLFGVASGAVAAAHAEAVAAQAAAPAPLVLEGRLLDRLAERFGMAPQDFLALARELDDREGGDPA
jgi:transcriptional regulator with XRE-family HTH domain